METIKEIIAEMRKDIPRVVDAKVILRNYADRIEQAVTNCNQLKMREALKQAQRVLHCAIVSEILKGEDAHQALNAVTNALSAPPRNCDVGTAEEQHDRFAKSCRKHEKGCGLGWGSKGVGHPKVTCPAYKNIDCGIVWAQMPYEKE